MKTCKDCAFYTFCKEPNKRVYKFGCVEHCHHFYAREEAEKEYVNKLVEKIVDVLTKR